MRRRAFTIVAVALVVTATMGCASLPTAPAATSTAAPADAADPLIALNALARTTYRDSKRRTLETLDPVIVARGDTVSLLRGGQRRDAAVIPPLYHSLEAVAHLPLAIYAALTPGEGALAAPQEQALRQLREAIPKARASFATRGSSAQTIARQELSAREWDALHVVIIAPHMPREGEASFQYFSRLLGEPAEGRRIIYAESLWEESRALDLLATHVLDGGVGAAFFGDADRMHRDLLSDAARDHVRVLVPAPPLPAPLHGR